MILVKSAFKNNVWSISYKFGDILCNIHSITGITNKPWCHTDKQKLKQRLKILVKKYLVLLV